MNKDVINRLTGNVQLLKKTISADPVHKTGSNDSFMIHLDDPLLVQLIDCDLFLSIRSLL